MNALLRELRDFFVSLQLTVVLLILSIILVFAATLAQVDLGIWAVQKQFFHSFVAVWHVGPLFVPLPGGYLLGGFLLVNLVAAHVYRFKFAWSKAGIFLTHVGLLLLLVGELLTGLWQEDYHMRINEGETKSYAESYRQIELAIVDTSDPQTDLVVSIPEARLAAHETVQHPNLPFRVTTRAFYPNSGLIQRPATEGDSPARIPQATMGIGQRVAAVPQPITYKQDERNVPAAYVELIGPEGSLGTWLVGPQLDMPQRFEAAGKSYKIALRFKRLYQPFSLTLLDFQHDVYPGTTIPKNFSSRVQLKTGGGHADREVLIYMNNPLRHGGLTFYQSGYDGAKTTILQVVRNPSWVMPYIACILVATGLVVQFGIHLVGFVNKRRGGRSAPAEVSQPRAPSPWTHRWLPLGAAAIAVLIVGKSLRLPQNPGAFDIVGFGRLPVLANGRIKPLDTVARSALLQMQNRQAVRIPNVSDPAVNSPTEWLLDVVYRPEKADAYPTFVVDNQELQTLIGKTEETLRIQYTGTAKQTLAAIGFLPTRYRRFSFNELSPHVKAIEEQARLADQVEGALRNPFQRAVLQLYNNLYLYQRLRHMFVLPGADNFLGELLQLQEKLPDAVTAIRARQANQPHDEALLNQVVALGQRFSVMAEATNYLVIPPPGSDPDPNQWKTVGAALMDTFHTGQVAPSALAYAGLGRAWREQHSTRFNEILRLFRADLDKRYGAPLHKSDIETRFNFAQPFYTAIGLYFIAFVLAAASWLTWPQVLGRSAFWFVAVAWLATTAGIATRMWLEGRPPVTNLYSSALFVGWGAVALCLVLESVFKNAIGSATASVVGFATLIIAHMLSLSGDTLEMMRAVLDSNFWLATHVVVVTLGYAATFLAGFLALVYVLLGLFTPVLSWAPGQSKSTASLAPVRETNAKILERMVYGIVCFATLFSFVGTVLGGIWADQSWGRFWGWDPKENGALIIVIWNAVILHLRWAGMIRQRGLMCSAIIGNIVTSWSWFGTNMLGVGLHSYGFTEAAFVVLVGFVASQLLIIGIGLIPLRRWRSFQKAPSTAAETVPTA